MSIKKAISLSFLLLANTIILAHAIVAHHHNGIFVVLEATHHEHDCNAYHPDDAQPVHSCNDPFCHGDIDNCTLSMFYTSIGDDRPVIRTCDFDFNVLPCFLILISGYSIPQIFDDIGLPFRQKPYLLFCNTEHISQSPGLRAPPVC